MKKSENAGKSRKREGEEMRTVRETEGLWKQGGKAMGKIKKERGNGDSMWAQETNVVDEEKAKGCVICGGRD